MPVLHQKLDPVFLGADGEFAGQLHDLEVLSLEFVPSREAGGALVGPDQTGHDDGGLPGQFQGLFKHFWRNALLEEYSLGNACAVANAQKLKASFVSPLIQPALEGDLLAHV